MPYMLENFGERPPDSIPPEKPLVEKFEDLNIDVGDVVVSKSGTRREVLRIISNPEMPGGGVIEYEKTDTDGRRTSGKTNFRALLQTQDRIQDVEKLTLPQGIPLEDPKWARHRVALKQIENHLKDETTLPQYRDQLRFQRAKLYREIGKLFAAENNIEDK